MNTLAKSIDHTLHVKQYRPTSDLPTQFFILFEKWNILQMNKHLSNINYIQTCVHQTQEVVLPSRELFCFSQACKKQVALYKMHNLSIAWLEEIVIEWNLFIL